MFRENILKESKSGKEKAFLHPRKKKNSQPKSSESDSDSQRDQILKKRKRNERDDDSSRKLSSTEPEKGVVSGRKSRTRYRSDVEEVIDGVDEKLPEELTKKLFIVGDKNLAILDKHFCVKVKGDQIFLKKVGKSKKSRRHRSRRSSSSRQRSQENKETHERKNYKRTDAEMVSDTENAGPTLEEMEDFLQQLRAKKIPREKQEEEPLPSQQSREMKFMARIQAKRRQNSWPACPRRQIFRKKRPSS
ncbi:uncharacterized protein TNIN_389211 [Trichonephila inaurata madagascariensis]|uniref:Uncharacterized protein n=1 Tax=Trichonephila inaurata madagascariensis TaxID=2747483 RepID=A0A8X6IC64_9ARAC|nr:uncharacterized protein TNIN_389211 [Trichonephila inaurata madagascariensis]